MSTIHVLNQFVWPDAAPTGVYAEQLADALLERHHTVRLIGTTGHYRDLIRPAPKVTVERRSVPALGRRSLAGVFFEYLAAERQFRQYVKSRVQPGDAVLVSTAPPTTPWLIRSIRNRQARGIYWLQDYYPELVRSIWDPPTPGRKALRASWDRALSRWDAVLKIGANLGYHGKNARVVRNWAPFTFTEAERLAHPVQAMTALYAGNFGHGHDRECFVTAAEELRHQGYRIAFHGDGPDLSALPDWINVRPPFPDSAALRAALLRAEVHLVSAHPKIQEAIFPSKIWNSLEAGRRIVGTGFAGAMAEELAITLRDDHRANLRTAVDAVETALGSPLNRPS